MAQIKGPPTRQRVARFPKGDKLRHRRSDPRRQLRIATAGFIAPAKKLAKRIPARRLDCLRGGASPGGVLGSLPLGPGPPKCPRRGLHSEPSAKNEQSWSAMFATTR